MGSGPTQPTEKYFDKGAWGFDGTQWRKLALLLGYTDRWAESVGETKSGDGAYSAITTAVPAGYIYILNFAFIRNNRGARGATVVSLAGGGGEYFMLYNGSPAQYVPDIWNGNVVLKAGDQVGFYMGACLNGDVIQAGVWGYKMAVT